MGELHFRPVKIQKISEASKWRFVCPGYWIYRCRAQKRSELEIKI